MNETDGTFDFQALDPLVFNHIETYRGANALRYGASTLGGAINFISPTGRSAPLATVRGEIGSFGYRRGLASVTGALGRYPPPVGFNCWIPSRSCRKKIHR